MTYVNHKLGPLGAEPELPEMAQMFQESLHKFAVDYLRPIGQKLDRMTPEEVIAPGSPYWEVRAKYLELGISLDSMAELPAVEQAKLFCILFEELGWGDAGLAISFAAGILPGYLSKLFKNDYLRSIATDEVLGCWGITEPDHGSDMLDPNRLMFHPEGSYGRPNCVATVRGDEVILNGQKAAWVSNGSIAKVCILYCAADVGNGISTQNGLCLVFPMDLKGISRGKPLNKLGQRALNQGEIFFDNVKLSKEHILAGPENYHDAVLAIHSLANGLMGACFTGVARAAYELALDYAHERKAGGVPIIRHQSVAYRLFHMFRKIEAARALTNRVVHYNMTAPSFCLQAAMTSKVTGTQTAFEVTSDALQIFGGNGLTLEYPMEKLLRDARASLIEDGCNEILAIKGGLPSDRPRSSLNCALAHLPQDMSAINEQLDLILAHQIERRAETDGNRDVVTFENGDQPDVIRTYRMLWDNGRRVCAALANEGMAKGDRFALLLQNHPEFVDSMVGSSIAATVYVPIDPRTKGDKLLFMIVHSGCKGIVCADYNLAEVVNIIERAPQLEWLWILGDEGDEPVLPRPLRVTRFGSVLKSAVPEVSIQVNDPSDLMQIMYTSGTTGDPKGVVVRYTRWGAVGNWSGIFGFQRDDRPYTGLSLTHGNAQLVTLALSLKLGMRAVLSRKFTKSRLWDIARKYGCTTFNLLGGMTTAIYSENPRPNDADNPVRFIISSGMPAAIWREFQERFNVKLLEFYGAVEGGMTLNLIDTGPVGSIGKPPPGLIARIVDAEGRDVAPFEHGEIIFRPADGPDPVVDYFRNPDASAKKTAGGWLRMGDIGHFDADGWMYFDYRMGGGIRHNGEFVNTAFIEKVIAESPLVSDVFVYGVPAASGAPGEKDVVAAVVLTAGASFTEAKLLDLCRQKLESSFIPSYFQVVEEIPKTASEKPLERVLLQDFSPTASNVFTQ